MTTRYINELFDIFKEIINSSDKEGKELLIANFIGKCYEKINEINKLFDNTNPEPEIIDNTKIKIGNNIFEKKDETHTDLDILFNYDYKKYINININNDYIHFVLLIDKIRQIFNSGHVKKLLELNKKSFDEEINNDFLKANAQILKKNKEILNSKRLIKKKDDLTKIKNLEILQTNKDEYKQIIDEFILNISEKIIFSSKQYDDILNTIETNINPTNNAVINSIKELDDKFILKYFNNYFNNYIKNLKKNLKENINKNENEFIKILFEHFKKTIDDFKFPIIKDVVEDLTKKYESFKNNVYDKKDNFNDLRILLRYEDLFNTNNGDWKTDSNKKPVIKQYKEGYDKLVAKLKPDKIEINKEFTELYNYSEKIKLINEKIQKGEKIQDTEHDFIANFDNIIELIISKNPDNEELKKQAEIVKDAFKSIKLKDGKDIKNFVEEEKKKGRVVKDVIDKNNRDTEAVYFEDYITFFKIPLKIFTYGAILFAFIVLFISFLGLLILIYDIIINTITLFVNSANSTNNLSLNYITKSIIKCNKNNYDKDRFFILTEQKQNLSIFNIGSYTLYLLIVYFITYLILVFYATQMKLKFIGNFNDIDNKQIYLSMIILLIIYSFIHLLIFKYFFKPYVYIPYKTINVEETEIDKLIASYIIVKTEENDKPKKIIKFNDLFELLYDASKIDELSDYFLKEIKNENADGCLEQKIIIYNLYEYLRKYVIFDENFKYNFKLYCSTEENDKPKYENGDTITFISMLKNDQINIISNYHEELNFINKLDDKNLEFYNKLNIEVSKKIKDINKKIITHNKTTLPFFITIVYMILIFLLNFVVIYFVILQINKDETDAYHKYLKSASKILNDNIYSKILNYFKSK